jgi:hypothetical protein
LSYGFKRIFGEDEKDEDIKLPIVGYTGHRKGDRSENMYGRNYRNTTIMCKQLERDTLISKSNYVKS